MGCGRPPIGALTRRAVPVEVRPFVDYYEVLQLSPRADRDTIERVYRLLAKRYHPDNALTGDAHQFSLVQDAYDTVTDPERRAAYDLEYEDAKARPTKVFDQHASQHGREEDRRILHAVLSLLYIERRRRPDTGGLGAIMLERALSLNQEDLAFPIWYMKQRGWVEVLNTGQIAITVEGIDRLSEKDLALRQDRLLPDTTTHGRADSSRPMKLVANLDD